MWKANTTGVDDWNGVSIMLNYANSYWSGPKIIPYNNGSQAVLVWEDFRNSGQGSDLVFMDLDTFVPY